MWNACCIEFSGLQALGLCFGDIPAHITPMSFPCRVTSMSSSSSQIHVIPMLGQIPLLTHMHDIHSSASHARPPNSPTPSLAQAMSDPEKLARQRQVAERGLSDLQAYVPAATGADTAIHLKGHTK